MSKSFGTPWTVAHQAPLLVGFPRQEHWSGLPFSSPGDDPNLGIEPISPAFAGGFLTTEPPGKPHFQVRLWNTVVSILLADFLLCGFLME